LFLRPDTNTRGHTQWFSFRVSNSNYPHQRVKLNILNNRKKDVLFRRGMKPFVLSRHLEQTKGVKWHQGGDHISYINLLEKDDLFSHFPQLEEVPA
jgi:hypothetical protein